MKKSVLIIENDEVIKDIVTYILETEGYEVRGAANVPEQLADISTDLILLDEWINKREGHMLCKEIKAVAQLATIPVVIFSTASDIQEIVKVCGADGYVQKPFDIDALIAEVRRFFPVKVISLVQ